MDEVVHVAPVQRSLEQQDDVVDHVLVPAAALVSKRPTLGAINHPRNSRDQVEELPKRLGRLRAQEEELLNELVGHAPLDHGRCDASRLLVAHR
jgi:hypothetical protein